MIGRLGLIVGHRTTGDEKCFSKIELMNVCVFWISVSCYIAASEPLLWRGARELRRLKSSKTLISGE